tara:strand:+ start:648 stop:917 length:270 start_codon:yes stop_codon:yes gene_type:complete
MIVQQAKAEIRLLLDIMPDSRVNNIGYTLSKMTFKVEGKERKQPLSWDELDEVIEFVFKEKEKPYFNYLRNRYGSEEWLQYLRANPELW